MSASNKKQPKMDQSKKTKKLPSDSKEVSNNNSNEKPKIDLEKIKTLNPLSPEIIEHQATINIGTLGHVSHGKSTLVEALSGIKPIKHELEKQRNITIKLGYANFKIYKCKTCPKPICYQSGKSAEMKKPPCSHCKGEVNLVGHYSFVDCPGHDCLMATMLNGAAVMDSALLMVAANADVPQPQTAEHLAAAEIMKLKNLITLQSKVDLVEFDQCMNNHKQISQFIQGTVAEKAPIVPVSLRPWQHINLDVVLEYIVEKVPVPSRDFKSPPLMQVVRSFDVNAPGSNALSLKGGVAGGTLKRGILYVGQQIEIRPGIIRKGTGTNKFQCTPIITTIHSLFSEKTSLQYAVPGGLIAVGTSIDPTLTKADRLIGQVIGEVGQLPDVFVDIEVQFYLMNRIVGSKEESKIKKLEKKENIMMNVGSTSTIGEVTAVKGSLAKITLNKPCCAELKDMISISRNIDGAWRLIGYATLNHYTPLPLN